jgi:hypothetical protein
MHEDRSPAQRELGLNARRPSRARGPVLAPTFPFQRNRHPYVLMAGAVSPAWSLHLPTSVSRVPGRARPGRGCVSSQAADLPAGCRGPERVGQRYPTHGVRP